MNHIPTHVYSTPIRERENDKKRPNVMRKVNENDAEKEEGKEV